MAGVPWSWTTEETRAGVGLVPLEPPANRSPQRGEACREKLQDKASDQEGVGAREEVEKDRDRELDKQADRGERFSPQSLGGWGSKSRVPVGSGSAEDPRLGDRKPSSCGVLAWCPQES